METGLALALALSFIISDSVITPEMDFFYAIFVQYWSVVMLKQFHSCILECTFFFIITKSDIATKCSL